MVRDVTQVKYPWLGAKIKQARDNARLSHDRLGAAVGTSRTHLIRLEKGWHRPSDALLARIAEATEHPLEFFDDGARRERQEAATGDDDEEAAEMALVLYRAVRDLVDAQMLRHLHVLSRSA